MTKRLSYLLFGALTVCLASQASWGVASAGRVPLLLDPTYDRQLQWQACADKEITPAKVIRWMLKARGQHLSAPSSFEFQPTYKTHTGQSLYVAAVAYKF